MGEIKGRIEKLNAASSSSSETIAADFRGIASQSMTVMNLMLDMVYQMENGSEDETVSDTSEQDMDAVINGKVSSCKNAGSVCGDINIGGIAGALAIEYEFDPEDDISPSYRREYELKAILQKCVNDADVTGRRDYVGGICGRMDLGLAVGCEGYGTIISENGGYVGGISGLSTGTVRECFAKCSLQGKKYIGGIVGRGSGQDMEGHAGKILNCYSMVDVVSYEQYAGAIAGDEGGTYAGNYFVSDSLAGISRYSRAGQAEPIAYEALLAAAGLPEPFRRITVRFLDGEELVRQLSLQYGEGLEKKDFPGIPEKEGCFSRWSEEEVHNLHFDLDIEAAYLPYETALPSKEMREDGREIFFVEGQFDDKASFVASRIGLPVLEGNQDVEQELLESRMLKKSRLEECWRLEIPQDGLSSHKVRYLSPDEKTEGWSVYIYRDGIWKKADLSAAGSYLEFEADEEAHYIAIVRHVGKWVQAAALLLAFVLIVLFFCLIGKWKKTGRKGRKRKKKTRKKKRPKNRI